MPCRNGHTAERRVMPDGWARCVECLRESNSRRSARYYRKNKERKREREEHRLLGWR